MAEQLQPAEYFEATIPARFADTIAGAVVDVAEQDELTISYTITGAAGAEYGLRVADGKLTVVPGGIPNSDMHTTLSYDDWANTHVVAWEEPAIDYAARGKVRVLKGLKGTLYLELTRDDGSEFQSTTIFGGVAEPVVTIRMDVADYAAMSDGTLNGQMAFMTGKLKFDGSLPLLMQLGALNP